jgi:hypothetical protein
MFLGKKSYSAVGHPVAWLKTAKNNPYNRRAVLESQKSEKRFKNHRYSSNRVVGCSGNLLFRKTGNLQIYYSLHR